MILLQSPTAAPPKALIQLTDNPLMVGVLFLFVFLTIFSLGRQGLLRRESRWVFQTHAGRSFELPASASGFFRLLLMMQTFLFGGLCLYFAMVPGSLLAPLTEEGLREGRWVSLILPLAIYLLQWFLLRWTGYLAHVEEQMALLERAFHSIYLMLGPLFLMLFIVQVTCHLSNEMEITLITALFGIAQILFVINGFKIFFRGIGSLCFIIFYLCTLEIAPLYLMYQKLMS